MEILILASAISLAGAIALIRGFQFAPSELSEFELARRADEGDGTAAYELYRRPLLPTLSGLRSFKIVLLTSLLATLLVATHEWWIGLLLLLAIWLATELTIAKGWLASAAHGLQRFLEPRTITTVRHASGVLKHFAPHHAALRAQAIGSREELLEVIARDTKFLTATEKARMQSALAFDGLKVADSMIERDKIATVDVKETVGPVLLDRLHKDGHRIFVAVKKDLDHIQGLLYMSDATSGHPEIKTVADAVRPLAHRMPQDAPLSDVLSAALLTGKQMFIVVDEKGDVRGLITLADVLARLNGSPVQRDIALGTEV
jgi:CBS domain containing-hemolysin-like protein